MKKFLDFESIKLTLSDQIKKFERDDVYLPEEGDLKKSQEWQEIITLGKKVFEKQSSKISRWRVLFLQLSLVVIFAVIWGKLISLQVFSGSKFLSASYANQIRVEIERAPRGVIYDRFGQILASSSPGFRIAIEPYGLAKNELEKTIKGIALILNEEEAEIKKKLEEGIRQIADQTITLAQEVDRDKAINIEAKSRELKGIIVEVSPVRTYTDSLVFAHLLGYTGEISAEELQKDETKTYKSGDWVGKGGVEELFEKRLRGKDGQELIAVDALGHKSRLFGVVPPQNGESLNLSIDARLQKVLSEEIEKKRAEVGSPGASGIALDPNTGEILAIVSSPSFDNNLFARGIKQKDYQKLLKDSRRPLFNRSISGLYPPASTFKIINASAALAERVITSETKFEAPAAIDLGGGAIFKDWKDHGVIDVIRAIAESSDSFFYKIGGGYGNQRGLGAEKIAQWSRKFGLGELTGIGLGNEAKGLVPDPAWKKATKNEDWYLGNTYNISIGQGDLLVTPLQLANATAAIVNNGKLVRPSLLKGFNNGIIRENFIPKEHLSVVKEGMRQATLPGGTAWPLRDFKISSGGKTGTGESSGKETKPYAWYTGFAPFENPSIVVTVVFEEAGEGSNVAAPVVKKAFEYWFRDQIKQ